MKRIVLWSILLVGLFELRYNLTIFVVDWVLCVLICGLIYILHGDKIKKVFKGGK